MDLQITHYPAILFAALQSVDFLLEIGFLIFQTSDQSSQMLDFRAERLPGIGVFLLTELCNQGGICFVRLVAVEFAFPISFDPGWVHDTDLMPALIQILCDRFTILSCGFQTGLNFSGLMVLHPLLKLLITLKRVADRSLEGAAFCYQHHIQLTFRYINP